MNTSQPMEELCRSGEKGDPRHRDLANTGQQISKTAMRVINRRTARKTENE